mgnify:FL=1
MSEREIIMKHKYSLAVFDLDGTVLDTLGDLAASTNFALGEYGLPARSVDEVRRFVGNGIRLLIERAVPENTAAETVDGVFEAFRAHYALHCADTTRAYDGIKRLLCDLRAAGIKTAVVSNKADFAVKELCRRYFEGLFDIAVGERENIRRKPAPDSVLEVMRSLSATPDETVYIGDSDVDIMTAKNSGTHCISVTWGFRDREFLLANGAYDLADTADELEKKIL